MSQPAISLLLPTRERCDLLTQTLHSVLATAAAPEAMEILLYVDEDDLPSQQMALPEGRIIRHVGPLMRMGQMTRELYVRSQGEHILLFNDDILCRTQGWDRLLVAAAGRFADGICLVYGNDLIQGRNLPTFPFLPRRTCERLGGICPGELRHDYIDMHLLDIFLRLRELGQDRLVYREDVIFEHLLAAKNHAPNRDSQQQDELAYMAWRDERHYLSWRLKQHTGSTAKTAETAKGKK